MGVTGREDEGIVGVVAATGVEIVCTHAGIQGGPEAGAFEFQNAKDSGGSSEKKAAETKLTRRAHESAGARALAG